MSTRTQNGPQRVVGVRVLVRVVRFSGVVFRGWLAEDGLVLGQTKVSEEANEIVVIPELLRLLDVRGTTITIDAMGCQRGIAEQIVDSGGHYVLAVKDNQPTLADNVRGFFADVARYPSGERWVARGSADRGGFLADVFREEDADESAEA